MQLQEDKTMTMKRQLLAVACALLLILGLAGCAAKENTTVQAAPATQAPLVTNEIQGSGTDEDPWLIGAGQADTVQAVLVENSLMVSGSGRMMDFPNPETRPWHTQIVEISSISIFDDLEYIGENAFRDAGKNTESVDVFLPQMLDEIGANAFRNVKFNEYSGLTMPGNLAKIGSGAFADTVLFDMTFFTAPDIAPDAFANTVAQISFVADSGWNADNMLPYGGNLTYCSMYAFEYVVQYENEDSSGSGAWYTHEGDSLDFNAEDMEDSEMYRFIRYEVLEGNLILEDPTNPLIPGPLSGNVKVLIVYDAV